MSHTIELARADEELECDRRGREFPEEPLDNKEASIGTPSVGPPVGIRCGNLFVRPARARRHQSGYVVPRQDPERRSNFVAREVLD